MPPLLVQRYGLRWAQKTIHFFSTHSNRPCRQLQNAQYPPFPPVPNRMNADPQLGCDLLHSQELLIHRFGSLPSRLERYVYLSRY